MYRLAKNYPEIKTALPAAEYLRRAYGTAHAFFTVPHEVWSSWSPYGTGFYNEPVIVDLIDELELVGISIGGGKIEIIELNGFQLKLSGNHPALLVVHNDRYGAIAGVANVLAKYEINIGHMEVARKEKGKQALMTIEVDQNIENSILEELSKLPNITKVTKIVE